MKSRVLLPVVSVVLTFGAVELVLWWLEPPVFPEASTTSYFIRRSEDLGWDGKTGVLGHFASGHCFGDVALDERGIRRNSPDGTYRDGFHDILFIGDSNTAGLEVGDRQTVPALLERGLRARGLEVNVVNLGVRGYGTDQSVRRALLLADVFRVEQVVYLYSDNDIYENNVLREIGRRFGKGVYWRPGEGFKELNYPVPAYENDYFGLVVLDESGRPVVYEGRRNPAERTRPLGWLDRSWRLYRRLADLRGTRVDRRARYFSRQRSDPFEVMNTDGVDPVDVFLAMFYGLIDGGRVRHEHRGYYDAQFEDLLGRLWEIPTLRKIHLVEFPNLPTIDLLADGEVSTNLELFEDLVDRGSVQGFVSLSREMGDRGVEYDDFTCRGGNHFAESGHRWIADVLLERLVLDPDLVGPPG